MVEGVAVEAVDSGVEGVAAHHVVVVVVVAVVVDTSSPHMVAVMRVIVGMVMGTRVTLAMKVMGMGTTTVVMVVAVMVVGMAEATAWGTTALNPLAMGQTDAVEDAGGVVVVVEDIALTKANGT